MTRLYSYCLPYDDGAAPNPYGEACTLVICKPGIRRTAKNGDWIVGTGAKHARRADGTSQDMSGRIIYAMRVSQVMPIGEYHAYALKNLPIKVPKDKNDCGDAIYEKMPDGTLRQLPGPHLPGNMDTDLNGKNALLSDHFFYFGDAALLLPDHLRQIAQNRQGHRVKLNKSFVTPFTEWIEGLGITPRTLVGEPLMRANQDDAGRRWCATCRADEDEQDAEQEVETLSTLR